ncbi:MAG: hypothetical protein M1828_007100 [Chrysothrix sp. TS-e1954]|nr:MAG: hypothetical protein M1828_007100 [Chrysothrix sp. TS-e1954]
MMPTILISGAGSGIGHQFLTHYSTQPTTTIHALDVSWPETASKSSNSPATIHRHTVDTSSPSSIDALSKALQGQAIDLFIHSAAVRGLVKAQVEKGVQDPKEAETLEVMDKETMSVCLGVNVVGSFLLIRSLLPNLRKSEAKGGARCVIMGSRMGSMAANNVSFPHSASPPVSPSLDFPPLHPPRVTTPLTHTQPQDGGSYAYRASKAGLNALVKSFSIDVPDVIFAVLHPGRVESRMTHVREEGAVDSDEAVEMMVPKIEGLGRGDSGSFFTREGESVPW